MRWRGRFGWILLGPTEHRVARYLDAATQYGRVTLPMTRIQADCHLGRSEAYRILRRLRILGLFGVENDQGGSLGGRRIWRIGRPDGQTLDALLHRQAWARITAWMRAKRAAVLARIRSVSAGQGPRVLPRTLPPGRQAADHGPGSPGLPPAGLDPPLDLGRIFRRYAPGLAAAWDADPRHAPRGWRPT